MTPTLPKLKNISEDELQKFLSSIAGYSAATHSTLKQAKLIGDYLADSMSTKENLADLPINDLQTTLNVAVTAMVVGFQLGRLFEIKAMARAMREVEP